MPTIDWRKLEKASGLTRRSLERYRAQGAPMPRKGETLQAWTARLHAWRGQNRQRPGPKGIPSEDGTLSTSSTRLQQLQEQRLEMRVKDMRVDLARKMKELVLRTDHEAVLAALIDAVREQLVGLGERMRLRLARREEEDVQRELEDEVRMILEELASGRWRPQRQEEAADRAGQ